MNGVLYVDSSALVKLVVEEVETEALTAVLADALRLASSALARVEVTRVARRSAGGAVERADRLFERIALLPLDEVVLSVATTVGPRSLRSLDALHLASALSLGDDLSALVGYDRRLRDSAEAAGLRTLAPA